MTADRNNSSPAVRLVKSGWNPLRECLLSTRQFKRSPSPTIGLFATATRCTSRRNSGCSWCRDTKT